MKGLSRTHNIWIGSLLKHQLCLHTDTVITVYSVPLHFPLYFSMERIVIPSSSCATTYWLLSLFCFPLNITTCAPPLSLSKRLSLAQHGWDTHAGPINWNLDHIAHGSSHEDGGYWMPWVSVYCIPTNKTASICNWEAGFVVTKGVCFLIGIRYLLLFWLFLG